MDSSDSDSDDDLLLQPVLNNRQVRADERKHTKRSNMLASFLEEDDRENKRLKKMVLVREETAGMDTIDDDQLRATVSSMSQAATVSRQETVDAMEGILMGGDDALGRQRRLELSQAIDTDRSPCLGVRKIIAFEAKRGKGLVKFFSSEEQAVTDLERIIKIMSKSKAGSDIVVVKKLVAISESKVRFKKFLKKYEIVRLLIKNKIPQLHFELTNWLIRLAQSAGLESAALRALACDALKTLLELRKQGQLSKTVLVTSSLESFCSSLECWIDMRLSQKPRPKRITGTGTVPALADEALTTDTVVDVPVNNMEGLKNLLKLWHGAIPQHCAHPCREVTVSKCIVALARLGLDETGSSSTAEATLRPALRGILSNLLDFMANENICGSEDAYNSWMRKTANDVFQGLSDLGPGAAEADDKDDVKAWLCHALILSLFPNGDFLGILCMQALENCLGAADMTGKVSTILTKTGNLVLLERAQSSLPWLFMASAYAALMEIDVMGDEIAMDGPRCLATVECAMSAFDVGSIPLTKTMIGPAAECGVQEDAAAMLHMVSLLDTQCQEISVRMNPMINNPHFRRVDYNLLACRQQYRDTRAAAARTAGEVKKISVQSGMERYLSNSNNLAESPISG